MVSHPRVAGVQFGEPSRTHGNTAAIRAPFPQAEMRSMIPSSAGIPSDKPLSWAEGTAEGQPQMRGLGRGMRGMAGMAGMATRNGAIAVTGLGE
jgi:hypothetical protein